MDGYAVFVWPSYAVAAAIMVALFVYVWASLRREERTLAQLQAAGGGRRRRAKAPGDGRATVQETGTEREGTGGAEGRADAPSPDDGGRT
nr:heme exporter protein CcmD [Roseospira navarrensis]